MEDGCTSVVMSNTEIKIGTQLSANDTYAGIEITGATYCIFGVVRVSQTSGTNVLKYSIEEVSPSNYNVFDDLILTGYTRYGLRTTGANSKYDSDAIIGTIVTS
jgi:hypothetical protein